MKGIKQGLLSKKRRKRASGTPVCYEYKTPFETYLEANTRYVQSPPTRMHHLN